MIKLSFSVLNELLQKPTRRLLKDDAIPTLFSHNADKPAKRKFSILRSHERAKRQHCENAFLHSEQVEHFEFKYNTKETQTERKVLVSSSTQTPPLPTKKLTSVYSAALKSIFVMNSYLRKNTRSRNTIRKKRRLSR